MREKNAFWSNTYPCKKGRSSLVMEMLCQIAMKNVETHHDFTFSTDLIMLVLGLV